MDRFRLDADPVVWSHVSSAMRQVEVRDSIAFRAGGAGYGWRVAAWLLAIVVGVARSRSRQVVSQR